MGEAKLKKIAEERLRKKRAVTCSKLCYGLCGFLAGVTFIFWLPLYLAWESYKENKPFWSNEP